jgi:hypothetical protein
MKNSAESLPPSRQEARRGRISIRRFAPAPPYVVSAVARPPLDVGAENGILLFIQVLRLWRKLCSSSSLEVPRAPGYGFPRSSAAARCLSQAGGRLRPGMRAISRTRAIMAALHASR